MRPITVTVGNMATAASATAIRTATNVTAGDLVLNGAQVTNGIGLLEADRNLLVTFAGAEPGLMLTVEGYNTAGYGVSEIVFGPAGAGTVMTVNLYRKVTRVASNQASVGAVSIGTSATGASLWVAIDPWAPVPVSVQTVVSGTVNYDIEVTSQDPASATNPAPLNSVVFADAPDAALVGKTANAVGSLVSPWAYARIFLNSGTGLVSATFIQPGVVNL